MPKILFDNQLKRQNCEDFYLNNGSGLNLLHEKKVYFILPEEQNHKMLLPLHAEPGMVQAFEEVLVEGLPVVRNSF